MNGIDCTGISKVQAEVYLDVADSKLQAFVRDQVEDRLHTTAGVKAASLRAGTQCCADLHFRAPNASFQQRTPTFTEDLVIPWEGKRLLDAVRRAAVNIAAGQDVRLVARVSEGPEQRRKLQAELKQILTAAGADAKRTNIVVLSAYKQGYSWLMDEIAPALARQPVA